MKRLIILLMLLVVSSSAWAGKTASELDALADPAGSDWTVAVDVSDQTMAPAGTNKRLLLSKMPVSEAAQAALDLKQAAATAATDTELADGLSGKLDIPTGTPDGTKYIRDDGTYATPPGSTITAGTDPTAAAMAESVPGSGITGTVPESVVDSAIARDSEVTTALSGYVPLAGGTMTGALVAPSFSTSGADGYHHINVNNTVAPDASLEVEGTIVSWSGTPADWGNRAAGTYKYTSGAWIEIGAGGGVTIDDTATGAGHTGVALSATEIDSRIAAASAASGYVATPPTYSDEPCVEGTYAYGTHEYKCFSDGWDYWVVSGTDLVRANWSNPTPPAPVFVSATVDGAAFIATFDINVSAGAAYNDSQISVTGSVTGASTVSCTPNGTTALSCILDTPMTSSDTTVTWAFDGTADSLESDLGVDVAEIVSGAVTNNTAAAAVLRETFEVDGESNLISGITWTEDTDSGVGGVINMNAAHLGSLACTDKGVGAFDNTIAATDGDSLTSTPVVFNYDANYYIDFYVNVYNTGGLVSNGNLISLLQSDDTADPLFYPSVNFICLKTATGFAFRQLMGNSLIVATTTDLTMDGTVWYRATCRIKDNSTGNDEAELFINGTSVASKTDSTFHSHPQFLTLGKTSVVATDENFHYQIDNITISTTMPDACPQ